MDSARDEIISKIRLAISSRDGITNKPTDQESPIFHKNELPLLEQFILEFKKVSGEIHISDKYDNVANILKRLLESKNIHRFFCKDSKLQKFLKSVEIPYLSESDDFESMEAGLTSCELLVAQTGSIIISSNSDSGRKLNVFPPIHIVYADLEQIVADLEQGIQKITDKYGSELPSLISNITGASRTADIEKTLVMGAHGPKELIIILNLEKR